MISFFKKSRLYPCNSSLSIKIYFVGVRLCFFKKHYIFELPLTSKNKSVLYSIFKQQKNDPFKISIQPKRRLWVIMRLIFIVLIIFSALFSIYLVNTLGPYFNKDKNEKTKESEKKELIIIVPIKSFAKNNQPETKYKIKPKANIKKILSKNKAVKKSWPTINTKIEDYQIKRRDKLDEPASLKNTIKEVNIQGSVGSSNTDSLIKQNGHKSIQFKDSKTFGLKVSKNKKYVYVSYEQINNQTLQLYYYDLLGALGKELKNNNSIELNVLSESIIYKSDQFYNIHAPIMLGLKYNQTLIKRDKFNINSSLELFTGENKSYKKAFQLGFAVPFSLGSLESGYKKAFRGTRMQNQYYTGFIDIEDNELFLNVNLDF